MRPLSVRPRLLLWRPASTLLFLLAALSVHTTIAAAQTGNAILRGRVIDPATGPIGSDQVSVSNPSTGFQRAAVSSDAGFYTVAALPPGVYTLRVTRIGYSPVERSVRLPVGETVTLNVTMEVAARQLTEVVVSAAQGIDQRTPEVSSNVSTEQIENLPLGSRTFLALATLASGVQSRQAGLSAGGASASNTNLFIDGASYKSDILPGGVAGQDPAVGRNVRGVGAITGNPFPQAAVQE